MPASSLSILHSKRLVLQTSAVVLGFAILGATGTWTIQKWNAKRELASRLAELDDAPAVPVMLPAPDNRTGPFHTRPATVNPENPRPPTPSFPRQDPNAPTAAELRLRQMVNNPPPERTKPIILPAPTQATAPAPVTPSQPKGLRPKVAAPEPSGDAARRAKATKARNEEITKAQEKVMSLSQEINMKRNALSRITYLREFIRRDMRSRNPTQSDAARRDQLLRDADMEYNKALNEVQKTEGMKILAEKEVTRLHDAPLDVPNE